MSRPWPRRLALGIPLDGAARALTVLAVSLGLPLLPAELEAAGARVAIGSFSGRRAARLRARVSAIVRRAGYGVRRGAGATTRITGRISRAGGSWRATLVVHRGGHKVAVVGWRSRRSREMTHVPGRARRRLLAALAGGGKSTASPPPHARRTRPSRAKPAKRTASPKTPTPTSAARAKAKPPERGDDDPLFQDGAGGATDPDDGESEDEAGDEEADGDKEADSADGPRRTRRSLALEAALGMHVLSRSFSYHDVVFGGLRAPPRITAAAVGGTLDWYPAAHFTGGLPARIGITASFRLAVAGVSDLPFNQVDHSASIAAGAVGITGWHRPWRRLMLRANMSFGVQSFSVAEVEEAGRRHPTPGAEFRFLRFGVGAGTRIWRGLSAAARIAYLAVLDSGELASDRFFPHATAGGVEAAVELSYALRLGFAIRLGVDLRRFFVSFNPEPGDGNIAGGAVDQYVAMSAALVYRLRWRRR